MVNKHASAYAAKQRSLELARSAERAEALGSPTTRHAAAVLREKQNQAAAKVCTFCSLFFWFFFWQKSTFLVFFFGKKKESVAKTACACECDECSISTARMTWTRR